MATPKQMTLWTCRAVVLIVVAIAGGSRVRTSPVLDGSRLGDERIVFQTEFGDIQMALYPDVAPVTTAHILKLAKLGAYNGNHFFRVDKGFVAQTASVVGGREAKLDKRQQEEGEKTVPLEVQRRVKHDKRGIMSMGRLDDPNSGGSSFSILLGPAPHLDMQYTIFGEVTDGFDTLTSLETVETVKEGIFVMPAQRITILSSYTFSSVDSNDETTTDCRRELTELRERFEAQSHHIEQVRAAKLP